MNYTFCIGCLNNYSKILLGFVLIEKLRIFSNNNLQIQKLGLCLNDSLSWNKNIHVQKDLFSLTFMDVIAHI
jgi:hypothetical protein